MGTACCRQRWTCPFPHPLLAHIDAVADLIARRDLSDVILVGHSYAGMVITGVADRLKRRLARLVYFDAAVPEDGDDLASAVPGLTAVEIEERRDFFRRLSPDGVWLLPPALASVGVTRPETMAAVTPRLVPHPLTTWLEPVNLPNGGADGVQKTYVLATDPPTEIMGYPRHAAVARRGGEWALREIHTGHAMMLAAPERTAELLLEAARMK
ncbi:alpha/beta fold hydrolase [Devosia nitrariae]|uniref:Esterase n=1 Tax=Devosia nitrariae TaxID=2071872 RepID=A0ABQ5WBF4_9HYPH|nr:alpha/beta hydrolase [Devosia nitrariae]GLQ57172.1 esterase [Devosia nitrariae]